MIVTATSLTGTCHGPDHRVATDHPAHRPVADRHQKGLVGDRRQTQEPQRGLAQCRSRGRRSRRRRAAAASRRESCAAACRASCRGACRPEVRRSSGSSTRRRPSPVTSPITANGQRSRSHSAPNAGNCPARPPVRIAPAIRCTRSRAATFRARRWECCAGRYARHCRRARPTPAPRSKVRRHQRRGSGGCGLSSPIAQQASITSCARRCISGLPRCTDAKSRSARCSRPHPSEEAAPPPSPIRSAGPPSTTMRRAGHHGRLLDVAPADVAEPARDHDRLVITAQSRSTLGRYVLLEACGNNPGSPDGRTRC